jgi:hypothetical protein
VREFVIIAEKARADKVGLLPGSFAGRT